MKKRTTEPEAPAQCLEWHNARNDNPPTAVWREEIDGETLEYLISEPCLLYMEGQDADHRWRIGRFVEEEGNQSWAGPGGETYHPAKWAELRNESKGGSKP